MPSLPLKNSITEHDFGADNSLYALIGGRPCLERVHKALYNKIFTHPTFRAFFKNTDQAHQENQQTDFMAMALGGPSHYCGRLPDGAHMHMFVTEEIFELRHQILAETLKECLVPAELRDRWLSVDYQFKGKIVKKTFDDCTKRYNSDTILFAPDTV
ncbi:MAG: group 1 truncated hemoglobin [Rhodospirillales bacterium]|nr:group 1 truncated hemoglobin [Rhodospirillales bacterium]